VVNRDIHFDRLATYRGHAKGKTTVSMKAIEMPNSLIVPIVGPCLAFVEKVRRARDGFDPNGVFIQPSELLPVVPVLGTPPCFETDDEELNQRVFTQGIQLTRDLPTFFQFNPKPVFGPVPFLIFDTNEQWGQFQLSGNSSSATLATTFSTSQSRLTTADAWLQVAAIGAAAAAAGAASQGIRDQVRRMDLYNGPAVPVGPNLGPGVLGQEDALLKGLTGIGALAAGAAAESLHAWLGRNTKLIYEAAPASPPPGSDPCADGRMSAELLGVADEWIVMNMIFQAPSGGSAARLFVQKVETASNGYGSTCNLIRRVAACARAKGATELQVSGRFINKKLRKFMDNYFAYEQVGSLDQYTVPVADTPENRGLKIARCLFDQ
jgi:hypothetical protein